MGLGALAAKFGNKQATATTEPAEEKTNLPSEIVPSEIVEGTDDTPDEDDDDNLNLVDDRPDPDSVPLPDKLKDKIANVDTPKMGTITKADVADIVEIAFNNAGAKLADEVGKQVNAKVTAAVKAANEKLTESVDKISKTLAEVGTNVGSALASIKDVLSGLDMIADVLANALSQDEGSSTPPPAPAAKTASTTTTASAPKSAGKNTGKPSVEETKAKLAKLTESAEKFKTALADQIDGSGISIEELGNVLVAVGVFKAVPTNKEKFHKQLGGLIAPHGYSVDDNGHVTRN